ncbi:cell division topological specificity factor MinE [Geminocystis sp. NIES-3709]|uniref:cell division topological specificity factor MinE n=1 Tax=Geminocystis sp. NIES-3709 TaxID=1617448 RepID=UPI0005FCC64C|nr:cell division topological specificity factor MinE [Geminocystis sp. NIES-3709]BAQ64579.1 cell division topological specificity factor MinE [Geminocystis sp. NIES-3709]
MFKDIVNTISTWSTAKKSRYRAKNRLKLVIAHDRAGVNPELIDKMRQEILEVVSRYLDVDLEEMEFSIQSNDRNTSLTANLPIKKVKRTPDTI